MPLDKIMTITPASTEPSEAVAAHPTPGNAIDQAWTAQNDKQRGIDMATAQRHVQMFDDMLKNPQNARQIAEGYGVQMSPHLESLMQNPKTNALMVEGAKIAKDVGITNPDAAKTFVSTYMQSGGDYQAANDAINGKEASLYKEGRFGTYSPSTGDINEAGNVGVTGKANASSTTGLPQGFMWGQDDQGNQIAVRIPGVKPSQYRNAPDNADAAAGIQPETPPASPGLLDRIFPPKAAAPAANPADQSNNGPFGAQGGPVNLPGDQLQTPPQQNANLTLPAAGDRIPAPGPSSLAGPTGLTTAQLTQSANAPTVGGGNGNLLLQPVSQPVPQGGTITIGANSPAPGNAPQRTISAPTPGTVTPQWITQNLFK